MGFVPCKECGGFLHTGDDLMATQTCQSCWEKRGDDPDEIRKQVREMFTQLREDREKEEKRWKEEEERLEQERLKKKKFFRFRIRNWRK